MYTESELHIAKLCVKNNFLTNEQLEDCLKISSMQPVGSPNTLGKIMVAKNYLTPEQWFQAQRAQTYEQSRRYDKLFGDICVEKEMVSEAAVKECLEDQKNSYITGDPKIYRLQDLLLERNLLTRSQIMGVMSDFLKRKKAATIKVGPQEISDEESIDAHDLAFGKLAAKNRMITENQLIEVFKLYRLAEESGHPKSVQALLEEKSYLSPIQSQTILRSINYSNWRKLDKVYAEIAVTLEIATERQVKEVSELQKSNYMNNEEKIVRILDELVARGLITPEESDTIMKHEQRDGTRNEIKSLRTTGTFPAAGRSGRKNRKDDSSSGFLKTIPKKDRKTPTPANKKPKTLRLRPNKKASTSSGKLKVVSGSSNRKPMESNQALQEIDDKVPCPFCKKKIRPGAKKCKYCGYYLV